LNNVILKQHLECAAAELSLKRSDPLLDETAVKKAVIQLECAGKLLRSRKGDIWYAARKSPHRKVNLRGTGKNIPIFLENAKQSLGDIDKHRSFFETHEGAIYLHRGQTYVITRFDHAKDIIEAKKKEVHYFTKAHSTKSTQIIEQLDSCNVKGTRVGFGKLRITEQVTGYDRRLVSNQKSIGMVSLDLPKLEFETQGLWIEIPDHVQDKIESVQMHFMGGIHALEHAAIGIMPLLVMTDRNDLGGISIPFHSQTKKAAVFIYDGAPGDLGLTRQAFEHSQELLEKTFDAIQSCKCETGCPACVHSPKCGSGNRPIDKLASLKILEMILSGKKKEKFYKINEPVVESLTEKPLEFNSTTSSKRNLNYGVLDIETRRSAKEVGGWNRADKMGVSCAIVYDSATKIYKEYFQKDIDALTHDLKGYDLVIGFNIISFDYKVLSGLSDFDFFSLPTLDILRKVHERLGYRLSLDHLAGQTLGCQKSADGLMALKWWEQGKMDKIIEYCKQDVRVTKNLYVYGRENQYLVFKNKAGNPVRVPVQL
jgi:DEAD/DEAH box helicase domain-containing protein